LGQVLVDEPRRWLIGFLVPLMKTDFASGSGYGKTWFYDGRWDIFVEREFQGDGGGTRVSGRKRKDARICGARPSGGFRRA